jgi:hypothetical protein
MKQKEIKRTKQKKYIYGSSPCATIQTPTGTANTSPTNDISKSSLPFLLLSPAMLAVFDLAHSLTVIPGPRL